MLGLVRVQGAIVQWGPGVGVDAYALMNNATWAPYRVNYMATIGQAAHDCGIGGIGSPSSRVAASTLSFSHSLFLVRCPIVCSTSKAVLC